MDKLKFCRTCRYAIDDHPHNCLLAKNASESIDKQKKGILGQCADHVPGENELQI